MSCSVLGLVGLVLETIFESSGSSPNIQVLHLRPRTKDIITADTKDKQYGQVEEYERQAYRQRADA